MEQLWEENEILRGALRLALARIRPEDMPADTASFQDAVDFFLEKARVERGEINDIGIDLDRWTRDVDLDEDEA